MKFTITSFHQSNQHHLSLQSAVNYLCSCSSFSLIIILHCCSWVSGQSLLKKPHQSTCQVCCCHANCHLIIMSFAVDVLLLYNHHCLVHLVAGPVFFCNFIFTLNQSSINYVGMETTVINIVFMIGVVKGSHITVILWYMSNCHPQASWTRVVNSPNTKDLQTGLSLNPKKNYCGKQKKWSETTSKSSNKHHSH